MFGSEIYKSRREQLRSVLGSGQVFLQGNGESPMNYHDNCYPFRQDSTFLYYTGIDLPGLHLLIDADSGVDILFGDEASIHDIIWTGPVSSMKELAQAAGIDKTAALKEILNLDANIMYLPPYRGAHTILLAEITGYSNQKIRETEHEQLISAVIDQRNIKSAPELNEMDQAVDFSYAMHRAAMKATQSGVTESFILGAASEQAYQHGVGLAYPAILTVRGEVLHNHGHHRTVNDGDIVLCDMGCESHMRYAGDITRSWPASGKWNTLQQEIYDVVNQAYTSAVSLLAPGQTFTEVHLAACHSIAKGLTEIGIMKGDPDEAVAAGAHTVFFPHGLGHMIGLDVHDMENLGEDRVGYSAEIKRNTNFGFRSLRLGRKLEVGHALTIEPGIYIIPDLLRLRRSEGLYEAYINYDKLERYGSFGGIRLEDNYVITDQGSRILGTTELPKDAKGIEALMAS